MEPKPPVIAKKLCKMVRVVFFMIQKVATKSKLLVDDDLHLLMKRGKIVAKALNDVMLHHYSTLKLSCRSHDMHTSFISPQGYEFSCSNSPAFRPSFYVTNHHKHRAIATTPAQPLTCEAEDDVAEYSPLVGPVRRTVRVTDSPFPLRCDDKDCHVDKEAEEFIQKFYKQLRLQKWQAACEFSN